MKLLYGLPALAGRVSSFKGLNHTSYQVEYTENPDCMSHHTFAEVIRLGETSRDLTLRQLLEQTRRDLGSQDAVLEFSRDVIHRQVCSHCGAGEELFVAAGHGEEPFGDRRLDTIGLPLYDVFTARSPEREVAYLVGGDEKHVLGQLARGAGR